MCAADGQKAVSAQIPLSSLTIMDGTYVPGVESPSAQPSGGISIFTMSCEKGLPIIYLYAGQICTVVLKVHSVDSRQLSSDPVRFPAV